MGQIVKEAFIPTQSIQVKAPAPIGVLSLIKDQEILLTQEQAKFCILRGLVVPADNEGNNSTDTGKPGNEDAPSGEAAVQAGPDPQGTEGEGAGNEDDIPHGEPDVTDDLDAPKETEDAEKAKLALFLSDVADAFEQAATVRKVTDALKKIQAEEDFAKLPENIQQDIATLAETRKNVIREENKDK